jgi:hypothetical protein
MALFSQRKGLRPMQKTLQFESIDIELRNRLWSALKITIWDHWSAPDNTGFKDSETELVETLITNLWLHHFKRPIDTIPAFDDYSHGQSSYQIIRDHFFKANWWQVYDFIEFIVKHVPVGWAEDLRNLVNSYLEAENAAYRFVDSEIVEITSTEEIAAIEEATSSGVRSVQNILGGPWNSSQIDSHAIIATRLRSRFQQSRPLPD